MTNRKGHAYFLVLIATMAMFVSISVVLYVTVNSRQATARYGDFVGRYDLAIAGNEQAFFLLRQGFEINRDVIINQVYAQIQASANPLTINKEAALTAAALSHMQANLSPYFDAHLRRIWNFDITFEMADNLIVQDRFHATTIVFPGETARDIFTIRTEIARYVNAVRGHPITIRSRTVWQHPGCNCINLSDIANCLDYYTLAMVELLRGAPPR